MSVLKRCSLLFVLLAFPSLVLAQTVSFVDQDGAPTTEYLESATAYLRVDDPAANVLPSTVETVNVTLSSTLAGDVEVLLLTETGADTGIFQGSIDLLLVSYPPNQAGLLETATDPGPPFIHDTIQADYNGGAATASADMVGSRIQLLDADGAEATSYLLGTTVHVRLEAQTNNWPEVVDWEIVMLEVSLTGDVEWLELWEVSPESGIFEGSIELILGFGYQTDILEGQDGDTITATHLDWTYQLPNSVDSAAVFGVVIEFLDDEGRPTDQIPEGGTVRLWGTGLSYEFSRWNIDTMVVDLGTLYSTDMETVELTETTSASSIFEGTIALASGPGVPDNGILETANSGAPDFLGDEITATYGAASSTAHTVTALLLMLDDFGREVATYSTGQTVTLRVVEPNRNDPQLRDGFDVTVQAPNTGDSETLPLIETGYDTGVFEGSLAVLSWDYTPYVDVTSYIWAEVGDWIEVDHPDLVGLHTHHAEATITGSMTYFIDAAGQSTSECLESSPVTIRVVDFIADNYGTWDTATVDVVAALSGDSESVTLSETGLNTGIFEGTILLALAAAQPGNGILETTEDPGPPHRFDTLTATYQDTFGSSSATADTLGSRTWLVDAAGDEVSSYAFGSTIYLRVEDHNANDPGGIDTVQVFLNSPLGDSDEEWVPLLETASDSGIFAGSIGIQDFPYPYNGLFTPDWEIQATYDDALGYTSSGAFAWSVDASIEFFDDQGAPTTEILESGIARVRFFSYWDNYQPLVVNTTSINLETLYTGDQESLTVTETGPDTGIFEGSIELDSGGGISMNGVLETGNGGPPRYPGDEITATDMGGYLTAATARTVPSRVIFLDTFGQEVTSYVCGERAYLRVEDRNRNNPLALDSFEVMISSPCESEPVAMTETGLDTGIFEGSIPLTRINESCHWDGILVAKEGWWIEAAHTHLSGASPSMAEAVIVRYSVEFVDASGQGVSLYPESSRVWVRVVNPEANWSPVEPNTTWLHLYSQLGGDEESLTLIETGNDTGIFAGSIELGMGPQQYWNGVLEITEDPGPPHRFDTLLARYAPGVTGDPIATDTADMIGSRTWFTDGLGAEVSAYAGGSAVHVRVEDHNANLQPAELDTVQVSLSSLATGDAEELVLSEVAPDSGIFEGSIPLENSASANGLDGFLQAQAGEWITAVHADALGYTVSDAHADITAAPNSAPSVAISAPADGSQFTEGDTIAFSGSATDAEDGDLSDSLSWSSDLDGAIGSGGSFSSSALTVGTHTITASVTDSGTLPASDTRTVTVNANTAPSVAISAPADGTTVNVGESVTFTGTATDAEDGDLTASLSWTSDVDGAIGSGGSFSSSALSVGTHTITASVTDSGGLPGSEAITLHVNGGPSIAISAPADGTTVSVGESVTFTGTATDTEDGDLTASLSWTSDVDGAIGSGGSFSISTLSVGTHAITASVTDSGGLPGSDAITLDVNAGPSVTISAPADGTTGNAGDSVTFTGTAADAEDGDLTASLSWSSDLDGTIGTGGSFSSSALSAGVHTITASVTDSGGLPASDAVTVTVNGAPSVSITAPADGTTVNVGESVTFTGTATDTEDGDLTANLSWSSDVDGAIGSGGSFSSSSLSSGVHTITASVSDSGGLPGSDAITLTVNAGPSVTISAPADGTTVNVGESVTFTGTADDVEDGDLTAELSWSSDLDGTIGSGGSFSSSSLSSGVHTITASVTDSGGLPASDAITVTVNGAPSVSITAPADGTTVNVGDSVTFTGSASDTEDGNLTASISWTSSLDGAIGTGGSFPTSGLSVGVHTITASVTDSGGLPASDAITVTVNGAPSVSITAPADGTTVNVGDSLTFTGSASDTEDGNLTASISWTSSLDGAIGTGGSFPTSGLSVGVHTITASVTDSGGLPASDAITVTVNGAPSVTITAPADGTAVNVGDSVTFTGSASDTEDGNLTASISWTSSLDGAIGTGGSFSTSGLSVGIHTITASVTDSGGLPASDATTVTVNGAPGVTITAPADGTAVNVGSLVTFTGTASDTEDGDLTASISWTSSIDGAIGTGGSFSTSGLSVGLHTITASVSDSGGMPASDAITVNVNGPPSVSITAPADGSAVYVGDSVTFTGTAADVEDGDLTANVAWTSSRDGAIGSGGSFSTSALSIGVHTITASVTDSGGLPASAVITVSVTDVVTITKAEYKSDKDELKVEATSSEQPAAVLTVEGWGEMNWKNNKYELKIKPLAPQTAPPTVTVTSDFGGTATAPVQGAPQPSVPGQAGDPSPGDGASGVSIEATLTWTEGSGTDSHDVYFGTSPSPGGGEFQGNQAGTGFDPGTLAHATTYYWRIDEVNALGTTAGVVWSFTTQPVGQGDTVTITKAEWKADKQELKVEATSSDQPAAVLTLVGWGQMTWKSNKYEYQEKPVANPGTVTVESSSGGIDTATVQQR